MSSISFLSLPRQLRDEIYTLVFISKKPSNSYASDYSSLRKACSTTPEWRLDPLNVRSLISLVAGEARSVLFNKCPVRASMLPLAFVLKRDPRLISKVDRHLDIKPYVRRVDITVNMEYAPEVEYWGYLQLVLECLTVQTVDFGLVAANT